MPMEEIDDEALDAARKAGGLPRDAPILELPRESRSLAQLVLDAAGVSGEESGGVVIESLPPAIRNLARALAPLIVYRDGEPLARMEYVEAP